MRVRLSISEKEDVESIRKVTGRGIRNPERSGSTDEEIGRM